jgi:hypothetical protein
MTAYRLAISNRPAPGLGGDASRRIAGARPIPLGRETLYAPAAIRRGFESIAWLE